MQRPAKSRVRGASTKTGGTRRRNGDAAAAASQTQGDVAVMAKAPTSRDSMKAPTRRAGSRSTKPAKAKTIALPADYAPREDEPFMNELQLLYFRNKLQQWKDDIIRQNRETLTVLHEASAQHADIGDRATSETDRALELRARDRQRKLVAKIDSALRRIADGSYGYCDATGDPIGVKRLEARPIATLSLEAQERHERRERVFRDD